MNETEVLVIRRAAVPDGVDNERLSALVTHALSAESATGSWIVSIVLVDDDELQALHRDFMDVDEPTDVMTFPIDEDDDGAVGGDIIISVDRASDQGPALGLTPAAEIDFLAVHGVLHLCGWDDHSTDDRARMLARQDEIIAGFQSIAAH